MKVNPKPKINGRYEVERELGRGAFGVTYLARDTHMHSQPVVVKFLREANVREIKALTRVNHPNVVRVSDQGQTPEGHYFFVMQYVEGLRLTDAIPDRGMELRRAARIVSQLGSALSAVHGVGVVHRDVKPENVMLQTSGGGEYAILIDFGLATVEDPRARSRDRETWAGTPLYMAPEQLRGNPVPASDVWALGVVAYEMVTGGRPFSQADLLALQDAPRAFTRPRALRPDLPQAAQEVLLKALSYEPVRRYAHAHEMGEAFLRAVDEPPPPPTRDPATPSAGPLTELLRGCQELFASLDQFRTPESLRAFFSASGLSPYKDCVGRGERLEFDHLLYCLYRAGRSYQGQALTDLLGALAAHYQGKWQEPECERLRDSLEQLLGRSPATAR
jgi:serine/threonine protein kinase